jgi:hypothetical protein
MDWTGWLFLAVSLAGLYALGLVLYRLFLSVKSLAREISQTKNLVAELMSYEPLEYTPAKPSSRKDLAEVLMARRNFEKSREAKAEARQRRLVQRISRIEIDKR